MQTYKPDLFLDLPSAEAGQFIFVNEYGCAIDHVDPDNYPFWIAEYQYARYDLIVEAFENRESNPNWFYDFVFWG